MTSSALLAQHLKVLEPYLKRKDVEELSINEPGYIWLKTLDKGKHRVADAKLTLRALLDLSAALATKRGQRFDDKTTILATVIPGYEFRIQVNSGPLVDSGIAISIRVAQARRFDYLGYFEDVAVGERLKQAVIDGANGLVAGPTGSGKTSFMNTLIQFIRDEERIATVEDAKELEVNQPDNVRLLKSKTSTDIAGVTYDQIVDSLMRHTPDRILMGEIDIRNTAAFLLLMNTGHKCMATIHANQGAQQAIRRMVLNAQLAGLQGGPELVEKYAMQELDFVVFIHRKPGRIFRAEVEFLKGAA